MSLVVFDFRCPRCGTTETRYVNREEMDLEFCGCVPMASTQMTRLPPGTRTHFRFADTKLKD